MSWAYMASHPRTSDHDLTLTVVGEVDALRPRLIEALQRLGYRILGEQPLYAKRGAIGGARWDCSFEVLDYPTTLTISLKQANEVAVVATFTYEIKSHWNMTKGDRQTLDREAEAIVALASERLAISACPGCGIQITDDSHFCRRCGAPLVVDIAELEVHRLTRKTRTAYHNLVIAIGSLTIGVLAVLPLLWLEGKFSKPLLWIGSIFGAFALMALLQGIWQLHYTLNPKVTPDRTPRKLVSPASVTSALVASPAHASVTEGTTELLLPERERRNAEPLSRKSNDTADIDDERLM
jgi:hypothetical protein